MRDCALTKDLFVRWRLSLHIYPFIHNIAVCTVSTQTYTLAEDQHTYGQIHRHRHAQTCWRIPLKTLAYTHQAWAAKIFSDHPSTPLSFPPQHEWRCVYVCVCVCVCVCERDRYSLSVRVATKCSDISRLCSPGSVIPPVPLPSLCPPLYLWRNASHPIMSNQPHTTSVLLFPSSSLC